MSKDVHTARPRSPGAGRWLARSGAVLLGLGLIALLVALGGLGYSAWQEHQLTQQWHAAVARAHQRAGLRSSHDQAAEPAPTAGPPAAGKTGPANTNHRATPPSGAGPLFAISVPSIGYFAPVREGVSLDVLFAGPGHYPGTAMPGQPGNVGVAAHNTYWIRFGSLRPGDQVVLETLQGKYTYVITGSRVVSPDNREVLAQRGGQHLTLTTCWPLWAGAFARQRLAIFAVLAKGP